MDLRGLRFEVGGQFRFFEVQRLTRTVCFGRHRNAAPGHFYMRDGVFGRGFGPAHGCRCIRATLDIKIRRQEVFDERKVCVFDVKRETASFAGVKFFLEADFKTLRIACPAVRRERCLRGVYVEGKFRFVGSRPSAAIGFERCRDEFSVPMIASGFP